MVGDVFIDTNVLVYAAEGADRTRAEVAQRTLERLRSEGRGIVSQQVLSEFARVVTERIAAPLEPGIAAEWVGGFAEAFGVVNVTPTTIVEALRLKTRYRLPFWDAQVVAAARSGLATALLSEDFSAGAEFDGVVVANPFEPGFDMDRFLAREL